LSFWGSSWMSPGCLRALALWRPRAHREPARISPPLGLLLASSWPPLGLSCICQAGTVRPFHGPRNHCKGRFSVTFKLPPLPYAYDGLAPTMSAETLQFHHDKHHQAYVDNGSKLIAGTPYEKLSLEEICKKAFAEKNAGIVNNAGQHYNHIHFWQW